MLTLENMVALMNERVRTFNPVKHDDDEQELCKAFIKFAHAYNIFNNDKTYTNWKKAKDATIHVLTICNSNRSKLTPLMNFIWLKSPEFNEIQQNEWIREQEERRRQEEERRIQEEKERRRQLEAEYHAWIQEQRKWEPLTAFGISSKNVIGAGGSKPKQSKKSKKSRKSNKHSKKSNKTKSRRH